MSDSFQPLTPDDAAQENVDLLPEEQKTGPPYGITALFIGMATLLLVRGLLRNVPPMAMLLGWGIALTAGLFAYSVFMVIRPKVHLVTLCILGAELGMLYGFPSSGLFATVWHHADQFATLVRWLVLAGITGLLVANGLSVEENPQPVAVISILLTFIMVSLRFLLRPHW
jgi:hypothetical protein